MKGVLANDITEGEVRDEGGRGVNQVGLLDGVDQVLVEVDYMP